MADILRFEPNVPEDLVLKFDKGKEVQGQHGADILFTLTDGRIVFVPIETAEEMERLRIRKGLPFRITKRTVRGSKAFDWKVERLDALENQLRDSIDDVKSGQRPGSSPAATSPIASVTPITKGASNSPQNTPATTMTIASQVLAGALIAAIDAAAYAERYAESKSMEMAFGEESIRALACTLYIQHAKDAQRDSYAQPRQPGGETWAH